MAHTPRFRPRHRILTVYLARDIPLQKLFQLRYGLRVTLVMERAISVHERYSRLSSSIRFYILFFQYA